MKDRYDLLVFEKSYYKRVMLGLLSIVYLILFSFAVFYALHDYRIYPIANHFLFVQQGDN